MEAFRFNELAETLYHFMWDDFCDWYLETAKVRIDTGDAAAKAVLAHCLDALLRLLHPICPFITEAIWSKLNEICPTRGAPDASTENDNEKMLISAEWPQVDEARLDPAAEQDFALLQNLIRQVRNARKEHEVPPSRKVSAIAEARGPAAKTLQDNVQLLQSLAMLDEVSIQPQLAAAASTAAAVTAGGVKLYVLDIIDPEAERARLNKQAEPLQRGIASIEAKLANASFVNKAPVEVVQRERERLVTLKRDLETLTKSLEALK